MSFNGGKRRPCQSSAISCNSPAENAGSPKPGNLRSAIQKSPGTSNPLTKNLVSSLPTRQHALQDEANGTARQKSCGEHLSLAMSHLWHAFVMALPCSGPPKRDYNQVEGDMDEDEEDAATSQARRTGIFIPTDQWKECWDMIVLVCILYSAVFVPYRICFSAHAIGWVFQFELAESFIFIVDVVFNFNTTFLEGDRFVTTRGQIAARYMSGWFWIDAPSSVPVELLDSIMDGEQSELGLLRFLRLFRLLRLLRLLRIGEYIADVEERLELNLTSLRIGQMLLKLIYLAHVLACFWFYTAAMVGLDENIVTWVSTYDHGSALGDEAEVQYVYSMYWALTTLTTVGYGDLVPTNTVERCYAIVALLLGALVFGYMLSSIGSLVAALDRNAALSEDKLDAIKEYMRWRRLPRELTVRVRRYYEHFLNSKTAFDEGDILRNLTPELRFDVVRHICRDNICRLPLIKTCLEPQDQVDFFMRLKPMSYEPKEVIYERNDRPESLYFLLRGSVEAICTFDGRQLYRIRQRQSFGEEIVTGRPRATTHRAVTQCDLYSLSSEDLHDFFQTLDEMSARNFHKHLIREHKRKAKLRAVTLRIVVVQLQALGRDGEYEEEDRDYALEHMAAMRFQLSWQRHCDRIAYHSMPSRQLNITVPENIANNVVAPPSVLKEATQTLVEDSGDGSSLVTAATGASSGDKLRPRHIADSLSLDAKAIQALHRDVRKLLNAMASAETRPSQHDGSSSPQGHDGHAAVSRLRTEPRLASAVNTSGAPEPLSPRCYYAPEAQGSACLSGGAPPTFFPNYRTASCQAEDAPTASSPDYSTRCTSPRQYMARLSNERAGYLNERATYQNRR